MRTSCRGISLVVLVLIFFVITIQSKKKPPKAKTRGRAAAVLSQSDCGPTEAYHNETDKCYETGSQAVCPEMMKFYADTDGNGDCDCDESDCAQNMHYLFWLIDNRCYVAFERGPCNENEWLTLGSSGDAECQKNPCIVRIESNLGGAAGNESLSVFVDENGSVRDGSCTCIAMSNYLGSDGDSVVSTSTTTTPSNSLRITKSDLTCTCSDHEYQISNSTGSTFTTFSLTLTFWLSGLHLPILSVIGTLIISSLAWI